MLDALKSGSIKALVLDASFLNYAAASDCDFMVVDAPFENYEQATVGRRCRWLGPYVSASWRHCRQTARASGR